MGLSATYSVTAECPSSATGQCPSLQYQWLRNGSSIAGATDSTYVTPPTAFIDSGAQFTVTVSNPSGSITSTPASLTVTARAPNPNDLRFQLVDSPATVNGWGSISGMASSLLPSLGAAYTGAIGTPLEVTVGTWGPLYEMWPAAVAGQSGHYYSLDVGYFGDVYSNFPADVVPGSTLEAAFGNGLNPASGVVNSLDLLPAPQGAFYASWLQAHQATGFDLTVGTVDIAGLQAAVQQEGAGGRVVTAISSNNGQVTYLSYGWQADTTTVYETQVATASIVDAPAAGADLAQQGYIITAFGMADASTSSVVLVGTRVAGDTMARPFVTATTFSSFQQQGYAQQGYAIVGFVETQTDVILAER